MLYGTLRGEEEEDRGGDDDYDNSDLTVTPLATGEGPRRMQELRIEVSDSLPGDRHSSGSSIMELVDFQEDEHSDRSRSYVLVDGAHQRQSHMPQIRWWQPSNLRQHIPPFVTWRMVFGCVFDILGSLCAYAFVAGLHNRIKYSLDRADLVSSWSAIFTPLWIMTGGGLLKGLFGLAMLTLVGDSSLQRVSENVVAYNCVAWGCSLASEVLIWLRLLGVLSLLPLTFVLTPLWILAFFGSLLLYFAAPPPTTSAQGRDSVEAFEAEVQVGARLNVWVFGLQGLCIALKLDQELNVDWSRIMLPTTLLLIVAGVVLVPYALGILWSASCALLAEGISRELLALFGVASLPLLVGAAVVGFSLSFISAFTAAMENSRGEQHLRQHTSDALVPLLQLFLSLAVLLPVKRILDDRDSYFEAQAAASAAAAPRTQGPSRQRIRTPRLQPLESPVVLLRQGGEYFRMASLSVRKRFRHTPRRTDLDEAEGMLLRTLEEKECFICIANRADAVLLPCGHSGLCYECATSVVKGPGEFRHCPICRGAIDKVIRLGKRSVHWGAREIVRSNGGVYVYQLNNDNKEEQEDEGDGQDGLELRATLAPRRLPIV